MKSVLIIDHQCLFPTSSGGRQRTLSFVQALAGRYALSHIYPYFPPLDDPESEAVREAKRYFSNIWGVSLAGGRQDRWSPDSWPKRIVRKYLQIPWEINLKSDPRFAAAVEHVVRQHHFDFILARHIFQAHALFGMAGELKSRILVDMDDLETQRTRNRRYLEPPVGRVDQWRKGLNTWVLGRYHRNNLPFADTCIVCSEDSRRLVLSKRWTSKIALVPNSIDVSRYRVGAPPSNGKTLLFCGTLSYDPNIDAVLWFVSEVLPRLKQLEPDVKLLVVGLDPPDAIRALASDPAISVHADVPDVVPFYEQASVVVVPIRSGTGTRVKILEAGACRRPVVSTTIGAEGLDLTPGRHCLIADDPIAFAASCADLLKTRAVAGRLVDELYQFVRSRYDTSIVSQSIRRLFDEVDDIPRDAAVGA